MNDHNHLTDIQVATLKALHKRKRAAPYCNSFLFINSIIVRSETVVDLVERGMIMKVDGDYADIDYYDLTSDGLRMVEKLG